MAKTCVVFIDIGEMAGLAVAPAFFKNSQKCSCLLSSSCYRMNATASEKNKDTNPVFNLPFEDYRKSKKKIKRGSTLSSVLVGLASTTVVGYVGVTRYSNLIQGTPEEIPLVL